MRVVIVPRTTEKEGERILGRWAGTEGRRADACLQGIVDVDWFYRTVGTRKFGPAMGCIHYGVGGNRTTTAQRLQKVGPAAGDWPQV